MQNSSEKENEAEVRPPSHWPVMVAAVLVVAMCAFIFYMSAQPDYESDALSLGVVGHFISFVVPGYDHMSAADQLYWQHTLNYPVRKTAHFLQYAALGALMLNLLVQIARGRDVRED